MYDEQAPDLIDPDELSEEELDSSSSRHGCLYLTITLVIIASLVFSSILTYFVVTGYEIRTGTPAIGRDARVVESGPTAAPATVVAAAAATDPATEAVTTAVAETAMPVFEPAAMTPEINRIAIVNADGQVETMSPSGEDRRALTLTGDNARFQFPTWSPDGHRLALIGNRMLGGAIYVLDDAARSDGLRDHQVYYSAEEAPVYLFWSPDSRNLGFLANRDRNSLSLNVVAGDGAAESRELAIGAPFYWDWSDDGRQLLIHAGSRGAKHVLALIDVDGRMQADNLAVPGNFQAPGIGPGGRYWAFAEEAGNGLTSLVVVDTQTGERSSHQQVGSTALGWSPVKGQIAFTKGLEDGHPLWGTLHVLDVATGEEKVLSTGTVLAFFWSPDGRQIAFITLGGNFEEDNSINASAPAKTTHVSRMANVPAAQFGRGFLTLSVVDVESGSGLRLLDFEPTAAFLSLFLPYFDQYALSHRLWSPDSRSIVLPVREGDRDSIQVISTAGGQPHELAEGSIAFWSQN